MSRGLTAALVLVVAIHAGIAAAATPAPTDTQKEVGHLLNFLETSGCTFYRNGTWYDSKQARAHLERKYAYLMKRGLVGSAEDFVNRAGSASSVSGESYLVKCDDRPVVPSGAWFLAELERFRADVESRESRRR